MSAVDAIPLLAAAGEDGYQISRSVRLRASASAYFNRTPASAGNRTTWTWSGWVKRGKLSASHGVFSAQPNVGANPICRINIGATDVITITETNGSGVTLYALTTTRVLRDASAWYHFVYVYDSTNATSTDRLRLYINGVRETSFSTATYPSLNQVSLFNSATAHQIGRIAANDTTSLFDGYITEINFIDGQALTSSSFGEFNPVTGVWQPKEYTGTYGTNGFYLNFSDNSAATAAAIGADSSGNGNNWTPNNISLTAGVTYDSMLDVPTMWDDGGNGRGNYFTLNRLNAIGYTPYSDGNLKYTSPALVAFTSVFTTIAGKWYYECTAGSIATPANFRFGSGNAVYFANGDVYVGASVVATVASYTNGDVIGVAVDRVSATNTISYYKNGVLQGTYTIATGPSIGVSIAASAPDTASFNFGQRPFSYTPPTGFKALNTQNIPTPTIVNGATQFAATLYNGNSSTRNISNVINNVSFQPDIVWVKSRSAATSNKITDSVRGATKALITNTTGAETTDANGVTAFNSDGFSLGTDTNYNNGTGPATYVAWQWKESISSGLDIVTYTGNGSNRTIAHNLGVAPEMFIIKQTTVASATNWAVWHDGLASTEYLLLNSNAVKVTGATTYWNSTIPTSSVFSVGTAADVNTNTGTYVAYLFASVAGFSAFGSYTGNGSGDGPFIYTGFTPRYVMIKSTTVAGANWAVFDTARDPYNAADSYLIPNAANAETVTATLSIDIVSNGFKCRGAQGTVNASAAGYVYAAFAENPFKYALAR